jgi:DNA-directed RNA polymerase
MKSQDIINLADHTGLVNYVIGTFRPQKSLLEDFYQVGLVGLNKAIQNYDKNKGAFSTYAVASIKNHLLNYIRSTKKYKVELTNYVDFASLTINAEEISVDLIEDMKSILDDKEWSLFSQLFFQKKFIKEVQKESNLDASELNNTKKSLKRKILKYVS